jgi:FtsP/CotA-like multicopper oxidase with cupredoxin domain
MIIAMGGHQGGNSIRFICSNQLAYPSHMPVCEEIFMKKRMIIFSLIVGAFILTVFIFSTVFKPQSALAETGCPTTNEIVDPPEFQWELVASPEEHYVGVMEYGEATFTIDGQTLTTRAYRQEGGCYSIPGPTMKMVPGNKYVLRFHNTLPFQESSTEHNVFKDPNATNVHTHGLHISGESPGDDVTRMFEGGYGGDYVYEIPADHMGGTFWYHAHHHGSTFLQVSTGGFGMIIIDDGADGIPQKVADMEERQILIGYLDPGAAGTGGDTLVSGTLPAGWTVNGTVNGNLTIPPDTWQHWRVLLADRDAKPKDVIVGENCLVKLLARDGVWRTTAPKDLPARTVNLTGASRVDLAVNCSAASDIRVGTETVANIQVSGTADTGPSPYAAGGATWAAMRPSYLRDLRNENNIEQQTIRMGARTVNGSKFNLNAPTFTVAAGAVQEWSIKGAANHPFHLHVYHMQAQAGCGGDYEEGEFYDTLAANCSVRFDLNPETSSVYSGRTIMHCHILEHEDQGAMGWMDVVGGIAPPTFPSSFGYDFSYSLSGNPPVNQPPTADFDTAIDTLTVNFTDLSSDADGSIDSWHWDFGDNATATTQSPAHTYSSSGTYDITLTVTDDGGAMDAITKSVTVSDGGGSPTAVEVGSVTVSTFNAGQGNKGGRATVVVLDNLGNPAAGATVTGDFSGAFIEPGVSGSPTDASGTTVIDTGGTQKGSVNVTFCVTDVAHPDLTDWMGEVCASN